MSALAVRRLGKLTTNLVNLQAKRNAASGSKAVTTPADKISNLVQVVTVKGKQAGRVFFYYAKTELTPPMPQELPQVFRGFGNLIRGAKTGTWKNVTFREAWLNTLVTIEVGCWFFVGEIIGKGGLIGYSV